MERPAKKRKLDLSEMLEVRCRTPYSTATVRSFQVPKQLVIPCAKRWQDLDADEDFMLRSVDLTTWRNFQSAPDVFNTYLQLLYTGDIVFSEDGGFWADIAKVHQLVGYLRVSMSGNIIIDRMAHELKENGIRAQAVEASKFGGIDNSSRLSTVRQMLVDYAASTCSSAQLKTLEEEAADSRPEAVDMEEFHRDLAFEMIRRRDSGTATTQDPFPDGLEKYYSKE